MNGIAIQTQNLSKLYRIGKRESYSTLRDRLSASFGKIFSGRKTNGEETIWALKDLSFEIKQGEIVGILGRNGAGKSTLLKILSRITEPTKGYADIYGRVSSLLEVGIGFHPELTGRENIYLNAAILGMKKWEIDKKFDEIISFAEIEKFIDTPVKHFSSGMYMRLAFSVAAHLETDILLVDEVLAVGDAAFQRKCLGKLKDVKQEGRTVLFVSHHLGQLRQLCQKGLWIDQGQVKRFGPITDTAGEYEKTLSEIEGAGTQPEAALKREGFGRWQIRHSADSHTLFTEGKFEIEMDLKIVNPLHYASYAIILKTKEGANIASWNKKALSLAPGNYQVNLKFPGLPVKPGIYYWYVSIWDGARKVDVTYCHPPLTVGVPSHSEVPQGWEGIINLPLEIDIRQKT